MQLGEELSSAVYTRGQGADGTLRRIIYLSRPIKPPSTR
jgi:hypothetical protein